MNLLIGNTCISLSYGLFSSESLFVKPSSSEWDGMRCVHFKYPSTLPWLSQNRVMSPAVFLFQHCSFHLLNTILSADQVTILEREKFYIRSIVKKILQERKNSHLHRQSTVCLWKSRVNLLQSHSERAFITSLSQGMKVDVICPRSPPFVQNQRRRS